MDYVLIGVGVLIIAMVLYLGVRKDVHKDVHKGLSKGLDKVVSRESFVSSSSFSGAKNGYVYKTGDAGLGYYLDE